jgi:NADH-quinone oxidoreductase subunit N
MPSVSPLVPTEFIHLAPEIVLSLLGLFVLMYDVVALRGRPSAERCRTLGIISIIGVLVALAATFAPDLLEIRAGTDTHFDVRARTEVQSGLVEEALFQGTVLGSPLVDRLNALLAVLLVFVLGLSMTWDFTEHWGEYYALTIWAGAGMMLLIASEELLTLFLTLETMTICLYLVTAFEKNKRRSAEGGLKYFVYGSVSSALFLFGLSLLYGLTGTTSISGIGVALSSTNGRLGLGQNLAGAMAVLLVLVGFGFKIAAVPFHQWAPDAYEGAPAPVTAWLATGSKLASIVALMKVLVQALGPWAHSLGDVSSPGWVGIVAVISAVTMTFGNFAALAQKNLKRMLAYSSIAHAGYMLIGILATVVASTAMAAGSVLFYLVVYSAANLGGFAVAAWLFRDKGTDEIEDLDGFGKQYPILAVCLLLLMLSLIGMPGLAGFFGKLFMFSEALNQGDDRHRLTFLWLVGLGLMNSVVSAFYYVRVLRAMFLRPTRGTPLKPPSGTIRFALLGSTVVCVLFGLYPYPLEKESARLADSRMFRLGSDRPDLADLAPTPATVTLHPAPDSSAPPERTALPDRARP